MRSKDKEQREGQRTGEVGLGYIKHIIRTKGGNEHVK